MVDNIFARLDKALYEKFVSVNKNKNPITKKIDSLSYKQKKDVIFQYSLFPKNIISLLVTASYSLSFYGWKNVVEELIQNINEEMGIGEGKISKYSLPHYTILRKMLRVSFDKDVINIVPNKYTTNFIQKMKNVLEQNEPEIVCGAVYALEASAVPELTIVKELVISSLKDIGKEPPKLLLDFFDWHINDIEIEHRDRLIEMVSMEINNEVSWAMFERGFEATMSIMDAWWEGLYIAINQLEEYA